LFKVFKILNSSSSAPFFLTGAGGAALDGFTSFFSSAALANELTAFLGASFTGALLADLDLDLSCFYPLPASAA
jgi:hypothetical protein